MLKYVNLPQNHIFLICGNYNTEKNYNVYE